MPRLNDYMLETGIYFLVRFLEICIYMQDAGGSDKIKNLLDNTKNDPEKVQHALPSLLGFPEGSHPLQVGRCPTPSTAGCSVNATHCLV